MARIVLFDRDWAPGERAISLKEFNASAKVAREGPFDRNVEKQLVFKVSASAREQMF